MANVFAPACVYISKAIAWLDRVGVNVKRQNNPENAFNSKLSVNFANTFSCPTLFCYEN